MITINPLEVNGIMFTAIKVELPKTNLLMITNEIGYIMCGALDVDLLSEKLKDRQVIAARAVGVRTIEDLLEAPLEKVTEASKEQFGWKVGMSGKEALKRIA
ncbi:DUF1805 domain-containing protein [Ornithinibacillus sp. BX22]|uniref:DUF1805 domain-containing protein n=2 Tax=Ornithinibacillus TaxID=484508 RepID=A0A923RJT0_9BACI|nr:MULTISPECIES: DUF1805 domain-containing protein [Ornithinibacillus]MBC5638226.1 DUF1805 domain-containing protein [Ornithinibacillus hominis]MBS3682145.1 DUF1805 domain-containing protein [Ornithinibacillus massiliensis]